MRHFRTIATWLFRRHQKEFSVTPEDFLKSINLIVDLDQLLENLLGKFRELLGATNVIAMLYEPITDRYIGRKEKGGNILLLDNVSFSRTGNLARWLATNRSCLDVSSQLEVIDYLSAQERELFRGLETQLVVPLITLNRLTGALFFGVKKDLSGYSPRDISITSNLANQTALAVEYAFMFSLQEDKLRNLLHSDKLATVGQLAAGAAHEIRNPLAAVRSTIQFLRKDFPPDKVEHIDGILAEVDRIDSIIKGLLSLSRISEIHRGEVDIHELLDETVLLLQSELNSRGIKLLRLFEVTDAMVQGDKSQLKQVFLNILLNSVQSIDYEGQISMTTREIPSNRALAKDNTMVEITIQDNGAGISPELRSRVFDPFFTTKTGGTGLGLSISYGIVSRHGGTIEIASSTEDGERGTTVAIILPTKSELIDSNPRTE